MQTPKSDPTGIMQEHAPPSRKPEVWLLSAYKADSHAYWADWLTTQLTGLHWHLLELPGRHFRWRIRSNPLSWLDKLPDSTPDLIFVTSMVDLATLKGLHPRLANVPTWCYFHENQFAYPISERQSSSIDHQMVQIYTGLAANRLFFNSDFNRTSYLDGISRLLHGKPNINAKNIRSRLAAKCAVLPIPVTSVAPANEKVKNLIVWNHRWEYDKAPEVFARAVSDLGKSGVDFQLALLGGRSKNPPASLLKIREELHKHIIYDGKADYETYCRLLGEAEIVVSTALHEFQGLSMLEAASAGARPLVPDALCYPEQYPAAYRYAPGDHKALAARLSEWLSGKLPPPVNVTAWSNQEIFDRWERLLRIEKK